MFIAASLLVSASAGVAPCILETENPVGSSLCWNSGKWVDPKLDLPKLLYPQLVNLAGQECIIGGIFGSNFTRSTQAWCLVKSNFVRKPEYDLDEVNARGGAAVMTISGQTCLVGGGGMKEFFTTAACFNATAKKWRINSDYALTLPRYRAGLIHFNGTQCLAGGRVKGNECDVSTECFDKTIHGGAGGWRVIHSLDLPNSNCYSTPIQLGSQECLVGGSGVPKEVVCVDNKNARFVTLASLESDCVGGVQLYLDGNKCVTSCNGVTTMCVAGSVLKNNTKYALPSRFSGGVSFNLTLS
jgi:hypothetical protein